MPLRVINQTAAIAAATMPELAPMPIAHRGPRWFAPIVGLVANHLGPRWAMGIGASSGIVAAAIAAVWLITRRGMRVGRTDSRFGLKLHFVGNDAQDRELATQEIAIVAATTSRTS